MENLENEFTQNHQEVISREAKIERVLNPSGMIRQSLIDRGLVLLGDTLIHMGTRIKDRRYTRLTTEEASDPTFLIML